MRKGKGAKGQKDKNDEKWRGRMDDGRGAGGAALSEGPEGPKGRGFQEISRLYSEGALAAK